MSGQPYDYRMQYVDPNQAMIQGVQGVQTLRANEFVMQQAQEKAAADKLAAEKKTADDAARNELLNRYLSSSDNSLLPEIQMKFPEMGDAVKKMVETRGEAHKQDQIGFFSRVVPALKAGRGDVALDVLNTRITALQNSKQADPSDLQQLQAAKKALESGDPAQMQQVARMAELSLATYDDKYAASIAAINKDQREQELQPQVKDKAVADAAEAQAAADKKRVEAANEQRRADAEIRLRDAQARGEIDATQARQVEMAIKAKELEIKQAAERREQTMMQYKVDGNPVVKLNSSQQKIVNDDVEASTAALNSATSAEALSKLLRAQNSTGGFFNRAMLTTLEFFGSDRDEVALAKRVAQVVQTGMMQNLPPGPATDKDIALVAKGYPDFGASDQAKADFMDSFARVQRNIALAKDLKVAWISANGHVGTLSHDIEFDGKTYAAGTTYGQALKRKKQGAK